MRTAVLALTLLLAAGGCDAGPGRDRPAREAAARMTPAERGSLRAQRDFAAGRLRIYLYGNPVRFDNPRSDPESRLPVRILLDCCVSDEARAETEAYNRVMREQAAAGSGGPVPPVAR